MQTIKKITRIILLFFFICLTSVGVGLAGTPPVLPKNKNRELENDIKIELVEKKTQRPTQKLE